MLKNIKIFTNITGGIWSRCRDCLIGSGVSSSSFIILNRAFFVRGWGLCGAIPWLQNWCPCDVVRFDGHLGRAVAFTWWTSSYRIRRHRDKTAAFHQALWKIHEGDIIQAYTRRGSSQIKTGAKWNRPMKFNWLHRGELLHFQFYGSTWCWIL